MRIKKKIKAYIIRLFENLEFLIACKHVIFFKYMCIQYIYKGYVWNVFFGKYNYGNIEFSYYKW